MSKSRRIVALTFAVTLGITLCYIIYDCVANYATGTGLAWYVSCFFALVAFGPFLLMEAIAWVLCYIRDRRKVKKMLQEQKEQEEEPEHL